MNRFIRRGAARGQRGWGMIATLVVLAVIMVLVLLQINEGSFSKKSPTTNALDQQIDALDTMNEQRFFQPPPAAANNADQATTAVASGAAVGDAAPADGSSIDPNRPIQLQRPAPTPGPKQLPGTLQNIQRARNLARELDVKTINESLMVWKMNHPNMEVTFENLQRTGFALPQRKSWEQYVIRNGSIDIELK